jgi:hypothetical protein
MAVWIAPYSSKETQEKRSREYFDSQINDLRNEINKEGELYKGAPQEFKEVGIQLRLIMKNGNSGEKVGAEKYLRLLNTAYDNAIGEARYNKIRPTDEIFWGFAASPRFVNSKASDPYISSHQKTSNNFDETKAFIGEVRRTWGRNDKN